MIVFIALLGCTNGEDSGSAAEPPRSEVNEALADDLIMAGYRSFQIEATEMAAAVAAFCDAPTDTTLSEARTGWWGARGAWKQVEIVQFGPIVEYPERLGPKLDDWPVNESAVEELVEGSGELDFDAMGSATRGLPVVEYLLYVPDEGILSVLATGSRRCAVLSGAAADVQANAERMVEAWQAAWRDRLASPTPDDDDMYDTPQDVVDEWVNRMVFTVENIRATRLGKPLGDAAGGELQPDAIESRYSGRSLQDARDAFSGVEKAWNGAEDAVGVRNLVIDDGALVDRIDMLMEETRGRLAAIPETLEDTIVLEPEVVVLAQDALQALQVALQVELAQSLSVTITFNDNDGD